jgi:hypothetical protein
MAQYRPPEPFDGSDHWGQATIIATSVEQYLPDRLQGCEHPSLDEKWHDMTDITVPHVERREPQTHTQCRQEREQEK